MNICKMANTSLFIIVHVISHDTVMSNVIIIIFIVIKVIHDWLSILHLMVIYHGVFGL